MRQAQYFTVRGVQCGQPAGPVPRAHARLSDGSSVSAASSSQYDTARALCSSVSVRRPCGDHRPPPPRIRELPDCRGPLRGSRSGSRPITPDSRVADDRYRAGQGHYLACGCRRRRAAETTCPGTGIEDSVHQIEQCRRRLAGSCEAATDLTHHILRTTSPTDGGENASTNLGEHIIDVHCTPGPSLQFRQNPCPQRRLVLSHEGISMLITAVDPGSAARWGVGTIGSQKPGAVASTTGPGVPFAYLMDCTAIRPRFPAASITDTVTSVTDPSPRRTSHRVAAPIRIWSVCGHSARKNPHPSCSARRCSTARSRSNRAKHSAVPIIE